MKTRASLAMSILILAGAGLGACSSNGTPSLATASVAPQSSVTAAKVDPACATLASQIDTLKADGIADRVEKASTGKTANVQVKRASLAKQAELNKANAEFQARCSVQGIRTQSAAIPATSTSTSSTATVAPVAAASATTSATSASTAKTALAPKN